MKIRTMLMCALMLGTVFALVPTAEASERICVNGTAPPCVYTYTYSRGSEDCSTIGSSQTQTVGVTTGATPAGYYSASASNYCSYNSFFGLQYGGSGITVRASGFGTPVGYVSAFAGWTSSFFGSSSSCNMGGSVYATGQGSTGTPPVGCPAGNPPMLPMLLP